MNQTEIQKILKKIEAGLNGDPDHDAGMLLQWAEKYRNEPGAETLVKELGRQARILSREADDGLNEAVLRNTVLTAAEDHEEALRLIGQGLYDKALEKLLPLSELIDSYPLPDDAVWMDFNSYLDSLVYQDLFSEEIAGRQIGRHPMHPGHILYTAGSLLIEMNRAEEALQILQQLHGYDPVCPKYIFELGEALKRTGRIKEALENALWGLTCAANRADMARCYRDMGYCLTEAGDYENAAMLYQLSLLYEPSGHAENEIEWIRRTTGRDIRFDSDTITALCEELGIPLELNETVLKNIELLKMLFPPEEEGGEADSGD